MFETYEKDISLVCNQPSGLLAGVGVSVYLDLKASYFGLP